MLKKLTDKSFLRFLLVGVCNTIVGTGVMLILYNLVGASYWVSSAFNYIIGSILSYFLNKKFTFKNNDSTKKSLPRFVLNISLCYLIAYGLAKPLVFKIMADYSTTVQENLAMLVGAGGFVLINYVGQRFFVFKDSTKDEN